MITNIHINYREFKAKDLEAIKLFYSTCFNWKFTDYVPTYIAFENSYLQGGAFFEGQINQGVLVVLQHKNME